MVHPIFKAACLARGLLDDDEAWDRCLRDAGLSSSPVKLRAMFATILLFNEVVNPTELFENHIDAMAVDFLYKARQTNPERELGNDITDRVLREMQLELLALEDQSCSDPSHLAACSMFYIIAVVVLIVVLQYQLPFSQ